MSAIDELLRSDTLQFSTITFHEHAPVLGDFDSSTGGFCKHKDTGTVAITLNARDLGIGVDVPLPFTGRFEGEVVTWSIDQPLDSWVDAIHITHVTGSIVAVAAGSMAMPATTCDGRDARVVKAILTSSPSDSTLRISTSAGDAVITQIAVTISAGEVIQPISFEVAIAASSWQTDPCGDRFFVEGQSVTFTALVEDLFADGTVTTSFRWNPGDLSAVRTDQSSLTVRLPAGNHRISVDVTVSTDIEPHSQTVTRSLGFAVLTADEAAQLRSQCQMARLLQELRTMVYQSVVPGIGGGVVLPGHRFVDPLWDPTPDELRGAANLVTRSYTRHELQQMLRSAEHLIRETTKFVEHTQGVISAREAQLAKK